MTDERNPVEEIRAIREKIWRKHKTMDAYFDHLNAVPSADVLLAQVRKKIEKAQAKPKHRPASRRQETKAHT
ncbi:MAG: hypothetical protein FWE88_00960 [Phycisphaerae bacterium]|nr:hypothetical protein [Phycisphaerae bacterium]